MLTDEVKQAALGLGADLVGIAPAQRLSQSPGYKPADLLPGACSVVVMAQRVLKSSLGKGWGRSVAYGLIHLNIKLNEIAYEMAKLLEDQGHQALPVFFPHLMLHPLKAEEFPREFSYKHAAVGAGLGQMGLSGLLLTPRFGPRVRLMAVITDAPLEPDPVLGEELCDPKRCDYRCVEACPVRAISRDGELDWAKCVDQIWKYLHILGYAYCAACMATCTVGR